MLTASSAVVLARLVACGRSTGVFDVAADVALVVFCTNVYCSQYGRGRAGSRTGVCPAGGSGRARPPGGGRRGSRSSTTNGQRLAKFEVQTKRACFQADRSKKRAVESTQRAGFGSVSYERVATERALVVFCTCIAFAVGLAKIEEQLCRGERRQRGRCYCSHHAAYRYAREERA